MLHFLGPKVKGPKKCNVLLKTLYMRHCTFWDPTVIPLTIRLQVWFPAFSGFNLGFDIHPVVWSGCKHSSVSWVVKSKISCFALLTRSSPISFTNICGLSQLINYGRIINCWSLFIAICKTVAVVISSPFSQCEKCCPSSLPVPAAFSWKIKGKWKIGMHK